MDSSVRRYPLNVYYRLHRLSIDSLSISFSGFSTLLLTLGLVVGRIVHSGAESFTFLYDHFLGLITASLLMAIAQALYVQVGSYTGDQEKKLLAIAGNSGSFFYDVRAKDK